ncbi:hypothetical protein EJ03DRAFT_327414 [Teratosphaeria nubilosa]|uniref:Uncharacterized protein n=1 Tax=Teratosphaeria nubilosa TaxID=161662 RepID=A0A6G1L9N7_9PEZI|nr:hypothetical protein EJ03DRAFT_327414 [Teratosphaeria nubilosa]
MHLKQAVLLLATLATSAIAQCKNPKSFGCNTAADQIIWCDEHLYGISFAGCPTHCSCQVKTSGVDCLDYKGDHCGDITAPT